MMLTLMLLTLMIVHFALGQVLGKGGLAVDCCVACGVAWGVSGSGMGGAAGGWGGGGGGVSAACSVLGGDATAGSGVKVGVRGYNCESPSWLSGRSTSLETVTGVPLIVSLAVGAGDAGLYCSVDARDAWLCCMCNGG